MSAFYSKSRLASIGNLASRGSILRPAPQPRAIKYTGESVFSTGQLSSSFGDPARIGEKSIRGPMNLPNQSQVVVMLGRSVC